MDLADGSGVVDTTGAGRWAPVRVTARLAEPVAALDTNPLALDGPAAWGAFQAYQETRGTRTLPPMGRGQAVDFTLPLATWTHPAPEGAHPLALNGAGLAWGWACSRGVYAPLTHTKIEVRRKPETNPMARYSSDRRHHIATGPLKARDTPVPATLVREVEWWALADPDALRVLLARVTHLGRHTRHGHGRVLEWRVEADETAWVRWGDRPFPHPAGTPGAIRAPYHHHTRRMPCSRPEPGDPWFSFPEEGEADSSGLLPRAENVSREQEANPEPPPNGENTL